MQQRKMQRSRWTTTSPCRALPSNSINLSSQHVLRCVAIPLLCALQAALDADGKPAWLRGLMDGDEGGADLLQEQAGASSEEEEVSWLLKMHARGQPIRCRRFVHVSAVGTCKSSCSVCRTIRMLSLAAWLYRQWMSRVWTPWQRRWRSSTAPSRVLCWSGRRGCSAPPQQSWLLQQQCRQPARRRTGLSTVGRRLSVRILNAHLRCQWQWSGTGLMMSCSRMKHGHAHRRFCGERQGVGGHWHRPARLRWSRRTGIDRVCRTAGMQPSRSCV